MGEVLGWDDQTRSDEVSRYQRRVAAELEAQTAPDDATAANIRDRVQDIRLG
jgi:glycerol-3-phosphate dehydrogenase